MVLFRKIILFLSLAIAILSVSTEICARISAGNIDESYAIERVSVSREGKVYAWDRKGEGETGMTDITEDTPVPIIDRKKVTFRWVNAL